MKIHQQPLNLLIAPPPTNFQLRRYQRQVISDLYKFFRLGFTSGLVYGPTGCGKTAIACQIIADSVKRGRRVLFVCHRTKLISQTQDSLRRFFGIESGVIWADYPSDPDTPVQIAMLQTLQNRKLPPKTGLVIFDECHSSIYYNAAWRIMNHYSGGIFALSPCYFVGLTATPWRAKQKEGFCQFFQFLVKAPYPIDLVKMGHLTRPRCFGYGGLINFDQLDVNSSGEYSDASMAKVCNEEFNAEVIAHTLSICKDKKLIAFCANINQAYDLAAQFNAAGVRSEVVVGDTPEPQREAIYRRLRRGETQLISSVGVLCEGFDEPSIDGAIIARPVRSRALLIQMCGRALRLFEGKKEAYLLDFGECFSRPTPGHPMKRHKISLCPKEFNPVAETKECPGCHEIIPIFAKICPICGYEFEEDGDGGDDEEGDVPNFGEILSDEEKAQARYLRSQLKACFTKGTNPFRVRGWFYERYGFFPPVHWYRHAIFKNKDPELSREKYKRFLFQNIPNVPRSVVRDWLNREFGGYCDSNPLDWWVILGLLPGANWEEIKAAYILMLNRYQETLETDSIEYRGKMKLLNFALDEAKQYVKR